MTAEIDSKPAIKNLVPIKSAATLQELSCRGCGNVGLSRIRRGALAKSLFFWLPLKHYICYRCNRKSYRIGK